MNFHRSPIAAAVAAAGAEIVLPGWLAPLGVGLVVTIIQALTSKQVTNYEDRLKKLEAALEAETKERKAAFEKETDERRERDHELATEIQKAQLSVAELRGIRKK